MGLCALIALSNRSMRSFAGQQAMLISFNQQRRTIRPFSDEPLSRILFHVLNLPILEISGVFPPWPDRLREWIRRAV
jgi:hypothetical protein